MKHLKLFFALFAMLALGVGNAWGAALGSGYEKVTNISNLTTGDRVVVYADDISKGVTGWNGSKDATAAESGWVEYLVEVASGGVTLKDEGQSKYISLTTKNTFTYADNGSVCKVNTTGVLAITLNGSDYFLYQNGTNYRMYTDKSGYSNYYPFYVYKVVAGGAETEDLGDALKWSAATATVQVGADDNEYPTLVNDKNVTVTYSSASTDVATINETTGVVTLVKEGTTTISAFYEGGEIDGVTYSAKNVSYTLTVKPAPLVIEPIEGGIIDILTHETFGVTSTSYNSFSGKQATNDNHSDAVYAGKTARNGNATQYNIQLNQLKDGRQFATTTSGGLARRVYVKWATQTDNTNARELYIYGSNTAFTGTETTAPSTKIGTIQYTTGAAEAYADLTGDYKFILITGSAAIYMDEIQVTWVSAAGTVVTPTISGETEFVESTEVSISTEPGYKVYYTLDDTEPTNANTEYTAPFTVNTTTTVKAIAYDGTSASDVVSATFKKLQSLTCAEAAEACTSTESTDKYVIRGYVTSIAYAYSTSDNNVTFWMADTKNGGEVLYAYRVKPEEETDKLVIVGDQVQVIGKIKTYSGKKEVNTGTYTITVPNPKYNVNITSAHGTVTATPASAVEGTEITLSVDVESGWVFQSWTVTDASSNPIEVVDNKFTMPASNVTVVANYTESTAADAVLKLSANGTIISTNTYKVGEKVELPATIENDCVKMFVGWSADANCATAPEYAPGADFTLTAEEHTLYAVYGTQTGGGEGVLTKMTSTDAFANGDKVVIVAYGTQLGMYQETSGTTYVKYWELVGNEPTVAELDDKTIWDVEADGENWKIGDATIGYLYNASSNDLAVSTTNASTWTITWNENGFVFKSDLGRYMACRTDLTTSNKNLYRMNGTTVSNNSTYEMDVYKYTSSAPIYSEFSTTCTAALAEPTFSLTEGEYNEAKTITISATEGDIYYTLDGNIPTKESTPYTEAIVLDECGTTTIKAIAISSDNESPVASATYTINLPITNTEATAYTPAEAIAIIDGACDKTEEVYVKGVVVSTSGLNTEYGNYDNVVVKAVDDESATPTEFTFFRLFKAAEKTKFTASDEVIGVGDIITAKGKLTKYNTTYELAEGCYLVSRVANVKLDAELAWNPETVTLTVGDAFTAPTLSNPHLVAGITYESSNEDVATVSAEGVIALVDDAVGTVTITASFIGDATYKPAEVTCTIKVKPVQEDCEGSDDFETLDVATKYDLRQTTAGWIAENAAVDTIGFIINGKTSAVGTITSPVLNGGIGSIKIRYANTYKEDNGVSFQLDIKQNNEVVKTYTITKANADVVKGTVYTELIENINVEGDFQMVFTNLSPSNNDKDNKDRVSIGRLCWTNYTTPQEPEIVTLTYNLTTDAIREHMSRRYVTAEDATLGEVQIILPSFSAETTEYAEAFLIVGSETLNATATYAADAENNLEVYTATATSEDGATIYNVTMNVIVPATQEYTFLATNGAEYVTEDLGEEGDPFIVYKISGEGYLNNETVAFDMSVDQIGYLEANINDVYVMGTATNLVEEEGTIWLQGSANDETGNTYSIEIYVAQAVEEVEIVITENVDVTLENLKLEVMGNMAMVTAGEEELSFWLTLLETENYYGNYSADMFDNIWYGDLQLQAYGDGIYNRNGLVVSFISEPDAEGNATKYNFTLKPETYTREGLTAGNFGTICLPFGSTNYTGAEFYEFVGKEEGKAYLASVTTLVAGVPYIFRATATELAVYSDGTTAATPGEHNGLVGTFTDNTEVAVDNYILKDNAICKVTATCWVNANRAYIVWEDIPAGVPQQMPGRRYIGMGVHGENGTTGLDNIMTTDAPAKVIVNGQLIIIRDGVKYNVQGQKL